MIRRLYRILVSLRFTVFLFISLSVIFLLGLWIPQKSLLKKDLYLQWKEGSPLLVSFLEALGFTDIYTSPVTLTLWTLFFLNLSLVMWQRVAVVRKKVALSEERFDDPETSSAYAVKAAIALPADAEPDDLAGRLRKAGYVFFGTPRRFSAVKNRFSPAATLLFHLSFFLMLLGGAMTVYTRFTANVDLAEGEAFTGAVDQYVSPPRMPKMGAIPAGRFMIERVTPSIEKETATGLRIDIVDERGGRQSAEINRPYKTDHTSFVFLNVGVAPLVIMHDAAGRELDGAYVKLDVFMGKQDVFEMHGLSFTVDFFPDFYLNGGNPQTRSQEMKNPAFQFYIEKEKRFIARKIIRPGESAAFGQYRITVPEMVYWVRFYVVKEYGTEIVYVGFGIATIALIWRLLFYRREIIGSVAEKDGVLVLCLAGRAEFYKALFEDEFVRLKRRIQQGA